MVLVLPTTDNPKPKPAYPITSYLSPPPPEITPSNPKLRLNYPLARSYPFLTNSTAAGN